MLAIAMHNLLTLANFSVSFGRKVGEAIVAIVGDFGLWAMEAPDLTMQTCYPTFELLYIYIYMFCRIHILKILPEVNINCLYFMFEF